MSISLFGKVKNGRRGYCCVVSRDDERWMVVKENDDSGWSSDDVML
jgi:hypothetical protein